MVNLPWLDPEHIAFPDTSDALESPEGLLAAGGQLSTDWLLAAYQKGIFPWFSEGDPILWWSPSPRTIIHINQLHISKSLRKTLNKKDFEVSINTAFSEVIDACAEPRPQQGQEETWISHDINQAYQQLHHLGYAHSVEVWRGKELIGGLYGVALGRVFFGESMFSFQPNGSKIALSYLVEHLKQWHYSFIDCQVHNDHLASMGAVQVPREVFEVLLNKHLNTQNVAHTIDDNTPKHWQAGYL